MTAPQAWGYFCLSSCSARFTPLVRRVNHLLGQITGTSQYATCLLYQFTYYPHRGRVNPAQEQTLEDLHRLLTTIPERDCICMLGDQ